jgi:hypothetical protein
VEFTVTVTVTNVIESLFEDPASFILKFDVAAGQELTIGTNPDYDYDYTIDWGDGTVESLTDQNPSHQYDSTGEVSVAIIGIFPALQMAASNPDSRAALVDVAQWGTQKWQSMEFVFDGCVNLTSFTATDVPDLSEVTSMRGMFKDAESFNGDIGNWDVSTITTFQQMFYFSPVFNQSLAAWDLSSATNMTDMLDNSGMSPENLNATIIGWSNFVEANNGPSNISVGLEGLIVCEADVVTAANILYNFGWEFVGQLYLQNCP